MIFKVAGCAQIHKLRVIPIYEADYNLLLAVKWRKLVQEADRKGLIHRGQFGGRPGCEAQSLALLEELKYDLAYTTRRTLFNLDLDAASCYDRIVMSLASLVNRKYGMSRKVVLVNAKTLEEAQYKLRTSLGLSKASYSHSMQFPIHGSGQGAGNSPGIWLFISSTLFEVQEQQAKGARFCQPDGKEEVDIYMVGFVDDTNGTQNDFRPQEEASLSEQFEWMERDAQTWSDILHVTGGKIELSK